MDPIYAVYPDNVTSRNDGETHYIGFHHLCYLYNVAPSLCINMSRPGAAEGRGVRLIPLRVQHDGVYRLRSSYRHSRNDRGVMALDKRPCLCYNTG